MWDIILEIAESGGACKSQNWLCDTKITCMFNPLNAELNPTCHLLALLGAHHILHVSRIRVNIPHPNVQGYSK